MTTAEKRSDVLNELKSRSDSRAVAGMARFGIDPKNAYGISMPKLRDLAKKIGKDHALAKGLWSSGVHEARILASIIDDPFLVTEAQMERWVLDFYSWDVCDQCCMNLFSKTEFAYRKAIEWSGRKEEFVKRAGFALMACLAVHDKRKASDCRLEKFLPIIRRESWDGRNYVRKAVNWALRQIGKRNRDLNGKAIRTAREIMSLDSESAKWIASDALRELLSDAIAKKLSGGKGRKK